jgi:hypothetical protein
MADQSQSVKAYDILSLNVDTPWDLNRPVWGYKSFNGSAKTIDNSFIKYTFELVYKMGTLRNNVGNINNYLNIPRYNHLIM